MLIMSDAHDPLGGSALQVSAEMKPQVVTKNTKRILGAVVNMWS